MRKCIVAAFALLLAGSVFAQSAALEIAQSDTFGPHLVSADGRTVYATIEDADGQIGCLDACAAYWPVVESDDLPAAGAGLDADLFSIVERPDGTNQVAYAGMPLYFFQYDAPGATRGQGSAGIWYLVSVAGDLIGFEPAADESEVAEVPESTVELDEDELSMKMATGQEVYLRICSSCHSAGGEGGVGVRLIGSARLANTDEIIDAVTYGRAYMPAMGELMTAEETAAVLTFIRNSWGNSFGDVPLGLVEEVRKDL